MKSAQPKRTSPRSRAPANDAGDARAQAAAWGEDGALAVLVTRKTTRSAMIVRGGRVVDELAAISRAQRIALLPDGVVLTIDNDGKARLAPPGSKPRSAHLALSVVEVAVCHGTAYVGGWHGSLAKLDAAAATWSGTGLREVLAPHLPADGPSAKGKIHSIIEGAAGPIIGAYCTYHESVVFEHTGTSWLLRGKVPVRINALARSPEDDVVYAIGDELWALDEHGARRLAALPRTYWSAGWLAGASPGLLVADLSSVARLSLDGALTPLWEPRSEVPNNHSLFVQGDRAAFVAGGSIHVLDGDTFVVISLRRPEGEDGDVP